MITRHNGFPETVAGRHHCGMGSGGWNWNDAWIFVSAVIAERLERDRAMHAALPVTGATLAGVLAAADFLHHSVPSRRELEDSVRRLAGAGLLVVDDDMVEVAPAGEQLWRTRPFSGLSSAVLALQAQLNRSSTPGQFDWSLDERTYAAAVRDYSLRIADGR